MVILFKRLLRQHPPFVPPCALAAGDLPMNAPEQIRPATLTTADALPTADGWMDAH
jgi:hypothetical protein